MGLLATSLCMTIFSSQLRKRVAGSVGQFCTRKVLCAFFFSFVYARIYKKFIYEIVTKLFCQTLIPIGSVKLLPTVEPGIDKILPLRLL